MAWHGVEAVAYDVQGGGVMAWIDDRIWCHPKISDISDAAFRAWINGIAYSFGFHTRGKLTSAQQRLVGATPRIGRELTVAGLWEENGDGIFIHDWNVHNGKAEQRAQKERLRLKAYRAKKHGTAS